MNVKMLLTILAAFLVGSGIHAEGKPDKSEKRVTPAPKYSGQEKSNNGHGNNEDSVDSSNPGNSKKSDSDPHKKEDSDPNVDDEKK